MLLELQSNQLSESSVDITVRKGSCPENVATVVLSQRLATCTFTG